MIPPRSCFATTKGPEMTERKLDEAFAAIFGHGSGSFAEGAMRCAKAVQEQGDAIRTARTRLERLAEQLKNECKQLQQAAEENLVHRNDSQSSAKQTVRSQPSRNGKRTKG